MTHRPSNRIPRDPSRRPPVIRLAILGCLLPLLGLATSLNSQDKAAGSISAALTENVEARARVVIVANDKATETFLPNPTIVDRMVAQGLTNLTGYATTREAWMSLVTTQDTVGIKIYTKPGPNIGTRKEVTEAVVKSLIAAGMPPQQIIIWDRNFAGFRDSGYLSMTNLGIRLTATIAADYDEKVHYEHPVVGQLVYTDHEFGRSGKGVGRRSFASQLVTREMTKIIMISPLLNHNRAGVCGNLYSLAMGTMDNTRRFERNPGLLAVVVPEMCALPELGDRVVLNIVDALVCQYQGQQRGLLHYSTALNEIRFSTDPVALDVLSLRELDRQRKAAAIKTGFANTDLYRNASLLQIGVSNPGQILVENFQ